QRDPGEVKIFGAPEEPEMAAATKKQAPPAGYPTGEAKEEVPQVEKVAQETNGEDDGETDRGISARFMVGRSKPRSHGFVPFDDYDPAPPRGSYSRVSQHEYPPRHGHGSHTYQERVEYEVSDEEDGYEEGYRHQAIPYNKKPQQYYRRDTYVVDQPPPPPPPRRRPHSNYYVRDEYVQY
ncbi:hypothetical protein NBB33_23720, partial [Salmonella sp. NW1189]|uniref:hypothetical protein n=1 Tax=Salmonella sp. NW1189 TaxID=2947625 RepID=UPI003F46F6DA